MVAVEHALSILGYMEMLDEDRPPREIWLDDAALEAHFAAVQQRREDKKKGLTPIAGSEMMQNELTKGLRGA